MSTYTPISSQVLNSTASSVTFSGIPQYYKDLILVCSVKGSASTGTIQVRFNEDTGNSYSYTRLYGWGAGVGTDRSGQTNSMQLEDPSSYFNSQYITARGIINNYSDSSMYKTMLSRGDETFNVTMSVANVWLNINPITSITIFTFSNSFASGSTFNLYGIASGGGDALGGNTVTTDGTYWYHTFTSSGAFIPNKNLTNVDYLVVAGGGGAASGGGGAGGLRSTVSSTGGGGSVESKLSLTANIPYSVVVGSGGALYVQGSNSIFGTITSIGGGAGVGGDAGNPNGGSGGGGGGNASSNGGTGISGQGYGGGTGSGAFPNAGTGGGGGAGAVGANGSGGWTGGNGGTGVSNSISGSSVTYSGGGGGGGSVAGGNGGSGGGGNGTKNGVATAGTINTGGGGGGTYASSAAAGGSGIVIVRYPV